MPGEELAPGACFLSEALASSRGAGIGKGRRKRGGGFAGLVLFRYQWSSKTLPRPANGLQNLNAEQHGATLPCRLRRRSENGESAH